MRWPFGPPHLTLKPSKKNKETKKQQNKKNKKIKKKKGTKKQKNTQKCQNKSFSIISQIFLFFGGCPKFPFFDNLAKKARTQKTL